MPVSGAMFRLVAFGLLCTFASLAMPQDKKAHSSENPRKCVRCSKAYDKAFAYVRKNYASCPFASQMLIGHLFLADGRCSDELKKIVSTALSWKEKQKSSSGNAGGIKTNEWNWHPVMAGLLLGEHYKFHPDKDVLVGLQGIVDALAKTQEPSGGWFHCPVRDNKVKYPVKDMGIVTSMALGVLWTAKTLGVKVPETILQKADNCVVNLLKEKGILYNGIGYGTGYDFGDATGSRGSYALIGLEFAGQKDHKVYSFYEKALPEKIKTLDKGHHTGGLHAVGVVLACHRLGPKVYDKLVHEWLDKLIDRQDADGGLLIGDDGASGGEKAELNGNYTSTAAFALMILLQDPTVLKPPKETKPNK